MRAQDWQWGTEMPSNPWFCPSRPPSPTKVISFYKEVSSSAFHVRTGTGMEYSDIAKKKKKKKPTRAGERKWGKRKGSAKEGLWAFEDISRSLASL